MINQFFECHSPGGCCSTFALISPVAQVHTEGCLLFVLFHVFTPKNVVIVMLNAPRCRINSGGASFNCDLYLHAGVFPANNYFGQRSTIFLDGLYLIFQQMPNLHFVYL